MKLKLSQVRSLIKEELDDSQRLDIMAKYDNAFKSVGFPDYSLDMSDCSTEFIEAFGQFCEQWLANKL